MKIELKERLKDFISIVKIIKEINYENSIEFQTSKVVIRAVDMAKTTLLNINIDIGFFEEYKIDKNIIFNLNYEILSKVLNSMKKGCTIEDTETEFIITSLDGKIERSINKYNIPSGNEQDLSFNYENKYVINSKEFFDIVTLSREVSEILEIIAKDDVIFKSKGNFEKLKMVIDLEEKYESQHIFISSLILSRLQNIKDIVKDINIDIGNDLPFHIYGAGNNIKLDGYIALRIEEGDE